MATLPITEIPVEFDNEYYEIENGLLVVNIDEDDFTDVMDRYLSGITFQIYTKVNEEYIPIKDSIYMWNKKTDEAITLDTIPDGSYMTIKAIVDTTIPSAYDVSSITEFPISISIV